MPKTMLDARTQEMAGITKLHGSAFWENMFLHKLSILSIHEEFCTTTTFLTIIFAYRVKYESVGELCIGVALEYIDYICALAANMTNCDVHKSILDYCLVILGLELYSGL
ncbi:hypothetical protein ACJX0J_005490 [Zea mays]